MMAAKQQQDYKGENKQGTQWFSEPGGWGLTLADCPGFSPVRSVSYHRAAEPVWTDTHSLLPPQFSSDNDTKNID